MKNGTKLVLLLMVVAGPTAAQSGPSSESAQAGPSVAVTAAGNNESQVFTNRAPRYCLRKGDTFDLEFTFSPEFNQSITVQPDGYVTLKGVGDLRVEGQTLPELTETVRTAYRKILHEPVITIALKDFEKPYFLVGGQVGRPGKYELRSDTTAVEAITIAGGFTPAAKHSQVLLFRRVSEELFEARVLNVKKMLNTRNLKEDAHLRPGDLLFVPQSAVSKIHRFIPAPNMGMYLNPIQ